MVLKRNSIAVLLVSLLTSLLVGGLDSDFEGFRYKPYFITNSFANDIYQKIKEPVSGSDEIVLVNGPPYNGTDSLMGSLVQKIANLKPKVIGVDYAITDSTLIDKFPISDSVKIVLAAVPIEREDRVDMPLNIFKNPVYYGHVLGYGYNSLMSRSIDGLSSLPEVVVSQFDWRALKKYEDRSNSIEVINYPSPNSTHLYYSEDAEFDSSLFTNKIVLIGKFGDRLNPVPDLLDNTDIHETPIGTQYGTFILYSEINTILGNWIDQCPYWIECSLCIVLCLMNFFVLYLGKKIKPGLTVILAQLYLLILLHLINAAVIMSMAYLNTFVDYSLLCWTSIISVEFILWNNLFLKGHADSAAT
jgi:hypothetical protein